METTHISGIGEITCDATADEAAELLNCWLATHDDVGHGLPREFGEKVVGALNGEMNDEEVEAILDASGIGYMILKSRLYSRPGGYVFIVEVEPGWEVELTIRKQRRGFYLINGLGA